MFDWPPLLLIYIKICANISRYFYSQRSQYPGNNFIMEYDNNYGGFLFRTLIKHLIGLKWRWKITLPVPVMLLSKAKNYTL